MTNLCLSNLMTILMLRNVVELADDTRCLGIVNGKVASFRFTVQLCKIRCRHLTIHSTTYLDN